MELRRLLGIIQALLRYILDEYGEYAPSNAPSNAPKRALTTLQNPSSIYAIHPPNLSYPYFPPICATN